MLRASTSSPAAHSCGMPRPQQCRANAPRKAAAAAHRRRGIAPCRALVIDPYAGILVDHELRAIQSLAREELVLEANLHASSLTVVQCMASYGAPYEAPSLLTPHLSRAAAMSANATGASIAAVLGATREDRMADLAACLATPTTPEKEESARRLVIRTEAPEEEALREQQFDVAFEEAAPVENSQLRSLFRDRKSRAAEALLRLTAMLPACPITGRRLLSPVAQA